MAYDAFISYSHAADGRLAPAVHAALQRLAKPWYRRRALRVFRDDTGLSVNPHLWGSIEVALDGSDWFVLLTSPAAAASEWVNREIEHWKQTKPVDRILPVVTEGHWDWDERAGDFVAGADAVPPTLRGVFEDEPRHLDLRWARDETQLDLRNGRFRDAMAQLAAPLHGTTKDELEGEDIRLHRRALRLAWGAVAALSVLLVAAIVSAALAVTNSNRAEDRQREAEARALAAASRALLGTELDTAALLAVEAHRLDESGETTGSLLATLTDSPRLLATLQPPPGDRVQELNAVMFADRGNTVVAGGTFESRTSLGSLESDVPDEAPVYRWAEAGVAEASLVTGGTVVELRADGNTVVAGTVGETSSVATVGSDGIVGSEIESGLGPELNVDGSRALVYHDDGRIELWDVQRNERLFRINYAGSFAARFSPDGSLAVVPSTDARQVTVLDASAGTPLGTLEIGEGDTVSVQAVSDDNSIVTVASNTGGVRTARVTEAGLRDQPLAPAVIGVVNNLALSGDGTRLVAGGDQGLAVWDTSNGALLVQLPGSRAGAALSPDGAYLLETGAGGTTLRNADTGGVLDSAGGGTGLDLSDDATQAAVIGGPLSIWDLQRAELVGTNSAVAGSAYFSDDRRALVTVGGSMGATNEVLYWNTERLDLGPEPLDVGPASVFDVAIDARSGRVATADDDGSVRLWSLGPSLGLGEVLVSPQDAPGSLATVDASAGATAIRIGQRKSVTVQRRGQAPARINAHPTLFGLLLTEDRLTTRDAAGYERVRTRLWDLETEQPIGDPLPCGTGVSYFESSSTVINPTRIAAVAQGKVAICDSRDGSLIAEFEAPEEFREIGEAFFAIAMATDGQRLALGGPSGVISVMELDRGEIVAELDTEQGGLAAGTRALDWSADGERLAYAVEDGNRLGVWWPDTNDVMEAAVAAMPVTAVALSPNGSTLAAAGLTGDRSVLTNVQLWDVAGLEVIGEPLPWPYAPSTIETLAFSPDGTELYATGSTSAIVRWDVDEERWIERACVLAGRNLTRAEWERYVPGADYRATCPDWPEGA